MENNVQMSSVCKKNPFFYQITSNNITSEQMMSTEAWNHIINLAGKENMDMVNGLVIRLAYAEDKIVYVLDRRTAKVRPAIITFLENRPDIVTVNMILNRNSLHVVTDDELSHMIVFRTRDAAQTVLGSLN